MDWTGLGIYGVVLLGIAALALLLRPLRVPLSPIALVLGLVVGRTGFELVEPGEVQRVLPGVMVHLAWILGVLGYQLGRGVLRLPFGSIFRRVFAPMVAAALAFVIAALALPELLRHAHPDRSFYRFFLPLSFVFAALPLLVVRDLRQVPPERTGAHLLISILLFGAMVSFSPTLLWVRHLDPGTIWRTPILILGESGALGLAVSMLYLVGKRRLGIPRWILLPITMAITADVTFRTMLWLPFAGLGFGISLGRTGERFDLASRPSRALFHEAPFVFVGAVALAPDLLREEIWPAVCLVTAIFLVIVLGVRMRMQLRRAVPREDSQERRVSGGIRTRADDFVAGASQEGHSVSATDSARRETFVTGPGLLFLGLALTVRLDGALSPLGRYVVNFALPAWVVIRAVLATQSHWTRRMRATCVLLPCVLVIGGCGDPKSPNVLLVTIDTLRPDRIGTYGDPDARTPHLDQLARKSWLFEEARVPYALTLPSHSTILTGVFPYQHGARRNDSFEFDGTLPSLPKTYREGGYGTGAVVSTLVLNRNFGLAEPFDVYHDLSSPQDVQRGKVERLAPEVTQLSREFVEAQRGPWFFWAHYFDPHDDYEPPPPLDQLYEDPYDGEITFTDLHLGKFLQFLEETEDRDLVIGLTSDHGEAFGEHQEIAHGYFIYDVTIRVPLMVTVPRTEPLVSSVAVRSVDLAPTFLEATGHEFAGEVAGLSLFDPEAADQYLETFEPSHVYGATELRGVVYQGYKYIEAPRPEIYDLRNDPEELVNLWDQVPEIQDRLVDLQQEHRGLEDEFARAADIGSELDEETRAGLASLGYLSGSQSSEAEGWSPRDPKDLVHLVPLMWTGVGQCQRGEWEEGVATLREVLAQDPVNSKAVFWVSQYHINQKEFDEAKELLEGAIELDPASIGFFSQLGLLHMRLGEFDDAGRAFRGALRLDENNIAANLNLAMAQARMGRLRRAQTLLEKVIRIDPNNQVAKEGLQRLAESRSGGTAQ